MDFRHLIVTCLFSMLRLSFEAQKIKENYAIFNLKREMSMKKTWSIILKVIIAVAGAIAGVVGVQAATL